MLLLLLLLLLLAASLSGSLNMALMAACIRWYVTMFTPTSILAGRCGRQGGGQGEVKARDNGLGRCATVCGHGGRVGITVCRCGVGENKCLNKSTD